MRGAALSVFAAAREAAERPALILDGAELSYGELARRVAALLPTLEERTAGAARAALVGELALPHLLALYALFELGCPVLLLHPRSSPRERRRLLAAAEPVVKIDPACLEAADPHPQPLSPGERGVQQSLGVRASGDLVILPTSGSSGEPKGVRLSRRALVAAATASAANLGFEDGDRWLLSLPIAHVGGLSILLRCLLARRTVVLHRAPRFDAAEVARVIREERVTLLSLVPTTLRRLLELDPPFTPPSPLRAILLGGAAAPSSLLESAAARGWPVLPTYGLTEAGSQVATRAYASRYEFDPEAGCGKPLPGVEVRIRDGEIEIRGPQLLSGYLGQAASPLDAAGWYATGDLGRLDAAGRLHVAGRRGDFVVSGGENVSLAEVEQALEEHPAIRAACCFGVPDPEWGESVAAAVEAEALPGATELRAFLEPRLARFKMPRRLVRLDALARLPNGKLDRRRTARRAKAAAARHGLSSGS